MRSCTVVTRRERPELLDQLDDFGALGAMVARRYQRRGLSRLVIRQMKQAAPWELGLSMSRVRFEAAVPQFTVADVVQTAEYYRDVLGFEIAGYWNGERASLETDPPPVFGILKRDQVQVFFNRAEASPVRTGRAAGAYDAYLRVAGLDALAAELRARGADILEGPEDRSYGQRELVVRDCNGLVLAFGEANQRAMESNSQEELIALAHAWDRSMVENDADAIGRYMANDWVIIGPDGRVGDRATFLGLVSSGVLSHDVMESHDLNVRIYGDSAVVISRGISGGKFQGAPFREVERVSCVFVRADGRWRCVSTHLSRLLPD